MILPLSGCAELGQQLRADAIRASAAAGSGHPTSSMSAADLVAVLIARHLRYDVTAPRSRDGDRLVVSKGHASPLLYAALAALGAIDDAELLTFRRAGSRLQGHPTPALPWVDVATGSLGQGLPIAVGMALAAARLEGSDGRFWVLCGDSEMAEGSMWEAIDHAGSADLSRLVAIVDVNRLGQRGETMLGWDTGAYARRFRAFGWHAIEIDGHDVAAIDAALAEAAAANRPAAVVARTLKGKGVAAVENALGQHGKPLADPEAAVRELGGRRRLHVVARPPGPPGPGRALASAEIPRPAFAVGDAVATREAYGQALAALGSRRANVVALDAEVSNSTGAEHFAKAHPDRFFEMYIAEQQMVAAAVGMQARGWLPFVSTFAAFLERAYEFVRMAAVSQARMVLCGSHAGVSIGQDGPSQMALEDLAAFRAITSSVVLYPSDANQAAALVEAAAEHDGITYLRTTRAATPVRHAAPAEAVIGGSTVLRESDEDALTIVAAGITVPEAVAAADALSTRGIVARVIDLYSVKPVDRRTLLAAARETAAIITVEDHRPEGGLGDAVLDALSEEAGGAPVRKLAVRRLPGSGTPEELLGVSGIDAVAIVAAALDLVGADRPAARA